MYFLSLLSVAYHLLNGSSPWKSKAYEIFFSIAAGRCREICPDLLCFCSFNNGFFFAMCANLRLAACMFYVVGTFAGVA